MYFLLSQLYQRERPSALLAIVGLFFAIFAYKFLHGNTSLMFPRIISNLKGMNLFSLDWNTSCYHIRIADITNLFLCKVEKPLITLFSANILDFQHILRWGMGILYKPHSWRCESESQCKGMCSCCVLCHRVPTIRRLSCLNSFDNPALKAIFSNWSHNLSLCD